MPENTGRLTFRLRLAVEPDCLENRVATSREDPQDGAARIKEILGLEARSFFQMIKMIAAILRARAKRAISGLIPLADNPVLRIYGNSIWEDLWIGDDFVLYEARPLSATLSFELGANCRRFSSSSIIN